MTGCGVKYSGETWQNWDRFASNRLPQENWKAYSTPESVGWSSEALLEAKEYFRRMNAASAIVIYDGAVLAAWGDVRRRYPCHELNHAMINTLCGFWNKRGKFELDQSLADLNLKEKQAYTGNESQATMQELLQMRSGVFLDGVGEQVGFKPERGKYAPGEKWVFSRWDYQALAEGLRRSVDANLLLEMTRRIAKPLQMEDFRSLDGYYTYEKDKTRFPDYNLKMSARDLARLGLLFLHGGSWGNQEVFTKGWAEASVEPHSEAEEDAFGYGWWVAQDRFFDLGMYYVASESGNILAVLPKLNMVVVLLCDPVLEADIDHSDKLKLIDKVLAAKQADPDADPALVYLEQSPIDKRLQGIEETYKRLGEARKHAYINEYLVENEVLKIEKVGVGLFLAGNHFGRHRLLPVEDSLFIIEDINTEVKFAFNRSHQVTTMEIELPDGRDVVGYPTIYKPLYNPNAKERVRIVRRKKVELYESDLDYINSFGR